LESGTLARRAVPTLAQDLMIAPKSGVPTVQKLLSPADVHDLITGGVPRISGYCHHALDVSHIATPAVLADALGQPDMLTGDGSLNVLRRRPAGLALDRTPSGGTDEERRVAVPGRGVEGRPSVGRCCMPHGGPADT